MWSKELNQFSNYQFVDLVIVLEENFAKNVDALIVSREPKQARSSLVEQESVRSDFVVSVSKRNKNWRNIGFDFVARFAPNYRFNVALSVLFSCKLVEIVALENEGQLLKVALSYRYQRCASV